jgi:hypothetical protein
MIKVGIISGQETFTKALLEELNGRPGVEAEWARLGPQDLSQPCPYNVVLDRLSHCYEFYQAYLKKAALEGAYVINNPFRFLCDDKFFNYGLARKLGVPVPKTVLLPSKEYDERVLERDDLHNLKPQIDWDEVEEMVGLPAIMKPFDGYGWREVYKVETREQLIELYNDSMMDVMMLQEFIDFEHYVRCFVVGGESVLPTRYSPNERRYIVDHEHLSPQLGEQIVSSCQILCRTLGYDINTVEFAIRDGVPFAIDFMNPVPEAKPEVITPLYFRWLIDNLCSFIQKVGDERRATPYAFTTLPPATAAI